jgi:hypothetical protein
MRLEPPRRPSPRTRDGHSITEGHCPRTGPKQEVRGDVAIMLAHLLEILGTRQHVDGARRGQAHARVTRQGTCIGTDLKLSQSRRRMRLGKSS